MINEAGRQTNKALLVSLSVSFMMLIIKMAAYFITNSTAALSDALESVVHVLAVAFAYYGLKLSRKPADEQHLYGHDRVEFLSVGIEGTVILAAGISIIYQSAYNFLFGYELKELYTGIGLMGAAAVINLALGLYVLHIGRKWNNMIVISNGKHTLTDVWTSAGVLLTLIIVMVTGYNVLDTIIGLLFAVYIMYEGGKLLVYAVNGIMDKRDPKIDKVIKQVLENRPGKIKAYHNVRHRNTGNTTWVELHALFDKDIRLEEAHEAATLLEYNLMHAISGDVVVTIHLEPKQTHDESHKILDN